MKYCSNCGAQVDEAAAVCLNCGAAVGPVQAANDAPSFGFAVLGFFIPLVGLILYLVWKDQTPLKAASAGKGALIGVVLNVAFACAYVMFIGALIGWAGY